MVEVLTPQDPALMSILQRHPEVRIAGEEFGPGISFTDEGRLREVRLGDRSCEVKGLIELMDNNPLVCAEVASVPGPAETLALIALGPALHAGIVIDQPTLTLNCPSDELNMAAFLATEGWPDGTILDFQEKDLGDVYAASAIAPVGGPLSEADLLGLYDEVYSRCFYVWEDRNSTWHVDLVRGKPEAVYRLRLTPGDDASLLSVQVMADRSGKCGAAQLVHMFNIMCGFEESLGIGS